MKKQREQVGLLKISESKFLQRVCKKNAIGPQKQKWLDAVAAFNAQVYGAEELAYMPSQLVQCTFPHSNPGNIPIWSRSTPWLTVSIRPGYKTDAKIRQQICVGYPYGTVPRLLTFYVMQQLEHQKNDDSLAPLEKRTVFLGRSLSDFMRNIGMNPRNGTGKRSDARRLRDQIERFFLAILSFDHSSIDDHGRESHRWLNMPITSKGEVWWDLKHPEQGSLFNSHLVISEEFYTAVINSLVPLDYIALRALKDSSLKLDLYAWGLYRSYLLRKNRKPLPLAWNSFMMQIGSDYKNVRQFRSKVKEAWGEVEPFLRDVRVTFSEKCVGIEPSAHPVIPARQLPSGQ